MFILKVCQALEAAKVPYAVVGGYAVALHGAVRGTIDVDLVIKWSLENLKAAEKAFKKIGLVPTLPLKAENLFSQKDEFVKQRNLIAWNFYNPANCSEQVDLIITYDLSHARTKLISIASGNICILSRKDLIEMKRESGRPQDLEDIRALEKL